jgi:cleavage stimulation factor subunit 1
MGDISLPGEKKELLQLMIRQLMHEGLTQQAEAISKELSIPIDHSVQSDKLENLLNSARSAPIALDAEILEDVDIDMGNEYEELSEESASHEFPPYTSRFSSSHKFACTAAVFSPDGKLAASGSQDTSIKVMDVAKMYRHQHIKGEKGENPVIRTFYDHTKSVTSLAFHPFESFLASASEDCTIKFFDHAKVKARHSYRHIHDSHALRHLSFHPSGDFLLASSDHPCIRLYDVQVAI